MSMESQNKADMGEDEGTALDVSRDQDTRSKPGNDNNPDVMPLTIVEVREKRLVPIKEVDDREEAAATARFGSEGGIILAVIERGTLKKAEEDGSTILLAYKNGEAYPLKEKIEEAKRRLEDMMKQRQKRLEALKERERRQRQTQQMVMMGGIGIVIAWIVIVVIQTVIN